MTRRGVPSKHPSDASPEREEETPAPPTRLTRKEEGKEKGQSSDVGIDEHPRETTAPWPRPDATAFPSEGIVTEVPYTSIKALQLQLQFASRKPGHAWDSYNSIFYNGLLRMVITPTRFINENLLAKMGIAEDVRSMLTRMGPGTLAYKSYPLYPELVRQFLASVELRYKDIAIHRASEGTLSYLCRGVLYEISIPDLCDLYGFEKSLELCRFPYFGEANALWNVIP